jgi:hypothetical protein
VVAVAKSQWRSDERVITEMMMGKKRNAKSRDESQTRTVTISIVHPVSVTCAVRRASPGADWEIDSILKANVEVTPRSLTENLGSDEIDELDRLANAAKDDE